MNIVFNKKLILIIPVFLIGIILFSGCEEDPPVNEDKFAKVYTDIVIAQDTIEADIINLDSLKRVVFKRYDLNQDDYKNMINYLNKDEKRWQEFFEKVISYVEEQKADTIKTN